MKVILAAGLGTHSDRRDRRCNVCLVADKVGPCRCVQGHPFGAVLQHAPCLQQQLVRLYLDCTEQFAGVGRAPLLTLNVMTVAG